MNDVTLKLGNPNEDDDSASMDRSNDQTVIYQVKIQTAWRRDDWVGKILTDDERYQFMPLPIKSIVSDLKSATMLVNAALRNTIDLFNGRVIPVWIDKSYTGGAFWECKLSITHDRHMFIRVRIYALSVVYGESGKLIVKE